MFCFSFETHVEETKIEKYFLSDNIVYQLINQPVNFIFNYS